MLKLTCFGYPTIWKDGEQITGFISEKAVALLVFLGVTAETHSRDYLTGLLWGETDEQKAKASLRTALYNIGQLLPHLLDSNRKTVGLASTINTDVNTLRINKNPAVHEADFLAGFFIPDAPEFEAWQLRQREKLRLLAIDAWHEQAVSCEKSRSSSEAINAWSALIRLEPWREEAHRRKMNLLARSGDFESALQQFKRCSAQLNRELGIEPAPQTQNLADQIRWARSQPRHNFPRQQTTFFGRQASLKQLAAAFNQNQLVSLVGMGGIGKTTLALAFGSQWCNRFLNGVFFVSLADINPKKVKAGSVPKAIADTLSTAGIIPVSREPAESQLLHNLANREMLLILDNFEHLNAEAPFLEKLMQASPQLSILITSRERTWLIQEQVVWLDGLEPEAAESLFTTTAQRVQPSFEPNNLVTQICEKVGRMPLAIELAASWVDVQSLAEILDELDSSLELLQDDEQSRTSRHQSITHLFEQSWQRIDPQKQTLLSQLTLFSHSFNGEAVRSVFQGNRQNIRFLLNRCLIQSDAPTRFRLHPLMRQFLKSKQTVSAQSQSQFSRYFINLFATVGEQAKQGFNLNDLSRLRPDHENFAQAWCWATLNEPVLIENPAKLLHSLFADQGLDEWVNRLVRFALAQLAQSDEFARTRLRLELENCYYLFWQAKAFNQAHEQLHACLKQLTHRSEHLDEDYRAEFAYTHTLLGWYFHYHEADLEQAYLHYQQAFKFSEAIQNLNDQAARLLDLGNVALEQENWHQAQQCWQGCAFRAQQIGNELTVACAQFSLGRLAVKQKDWALATEKLKLSENALTHHHGLSSSWYATKGIMAALNNDHDTAQAAFSAQLEICQQYGRIDHTITAYCNLARVARLKNDQERGNHYFFLAEQLSQQKKIKSLQNQVEQAKLKKTFTTNEV